MDLNIEIDISDAIRARVEAVEGMSIFVGVKDKQEKAAIPRDLSEGTRKLPNYSKGLEVRKVKSRDKGYTIAEQMADLEQVWGLFSGALDDKNNADLVEIMEILGEVFEQGEATEELKRRLENGAQALIRNRILDRRLGSNSQQTVDEKGRDMPLLDTGTLFGAIKGWIENL